MQAGFTLVEVMAASALLSILAICVVRAWSVFDQMSFDNMLRQKAVFVLNGEMERLARMWNTSTFATSAKNAGGYPAIPGITGSTIRYTYGTAMEAASFVTASSSTFQGSDTALWMPSATPPANYVWIDRGRNIMASLSWASCSVTTNVPRDCWGQSGTAGATTNCWSGTATSTAPCQLATLILIYPYQLQGGTATAAANLKMLTLSTILGRRT